MMMGLRQKSETALEYEGATLLKEDIRLGCAPVQHEGESRAMFIARLAGVYYTSLSAVEEALTGADG